MEIVDSIKANLKTSLSIALLLTVAMPYAILSVILYGSTKLPN